MFKFLSFIDLLRSFVGTPPIFKLEYFGENTVDLNSKTSNDLNVCGTLSQRASAVLGQCWGSRLGTMNG